MPVPKTAEADGIEMLKQINAFKGVATTSIVLKRIPAAPSGKKTIIEQKIPLTKITIPFAVPFPPDKPVILLWTFVSFEVEGVARLDIVVPPTKKK